MSNNKTRALNQSDLELLDAIEAAGGIGALSQPLSAVLTALAAVMSATATAAAQRAALGLVIGTDIAAQSSVTTATPRTAAGTTDALVLADAGKRIRYTNSGGVTVTIPADTDVALPVNTVLEACQVGAGQVTFVGADGVTLLSDGAKLKTAGQYAVVGFVKDAANTWLLSGDLSA